MSTLDHPMLSIWDSSSVDRVSQYSSSWDRGGQRYHPIQEARLHPWASKAAATLPGASNGVLLISEMIGPIGIPDFTAVVGGKSQITARLASGIDPITSPMDCQLLASLYSSRPRRLETIAHELSADLEALQSRLGVLERKGAVQQLRKGLYIRESAMTPGGTLYAIEAKIGNWRRAVRQARGYRTWTNNYVLILDEVGEKGRQAVLADIEADRAGLVMGNKWVRKPSPRLPSKVNQILGFEHLMAGLRDHHPSSTTNWSTPANKGSIH